MIPVAQASRELNITEDLIIKAALTTIVKYRVTRGTPPDHLMRSNMAMDEPESQASDQINEETATLHAVDPQTAKLIGALDSYRERFEEAGGDPADALVTGIEYALKEAGVITPAKVFLHGMAYSQHHL